MKDSNCSVITKDKNSQILILIQNRRRKQFIRTRKQGLMAGCEKLKNALGIPLRDCPSLVGGRPAKSVVERPRGFKSHIPRHFQIQFNISINFKN
jgi:hypothetical protein